MNFSKMLLNLAKDSSSVAVNALISMTTILDLEKEEQLDLYKSVHKAREKIIEVLNEVHEKLDACIEVKK